LNKLASLQQICYEQEDTISKLKQTIMDSLEEEEQDKIESEQNHERE
jgi:hypothetical protein